MDRPKAAAPRDPEEVLRGRLKRYRAERGWSQHELARRVTEVGFTMHQTTVAKIESQGSQKPRKVTVGELLALAVALDVPPVALVLPFEDPTAVAVTPTTVASVWDTFEWFSGSNAMGVTDPAHWRRATEAIRAYRRVKSAESEAAYANMRALRLRDRGQAEAAERSDAEYMRWLGELGTELEVMRELGLPTDGVVDQAWLNDLERYGIDGAYRRAVDRRGEDD